MAIPCSGPISMSMIHDTVGNGSYSLRSLSAAVGFSTPDAMSEFYCYNPVTYNYYGTYFTDPCGPQRDVYRRSSDNYFFWYDGSTYYPIDYAYYYTYEYYDYYEMWYVYTIWFIGATSIYPAGTTQSWCAPY